MRRRLLSVTTLLLSCAWSGCGEDVSIAGSSNAAYRTPSLTPRGFVEASIDPGTCREYVVDHWLSPGDSIAFSMRQWKVDAIVRLRIGPAPDLHVFDSPTASMGLERGVVVATSEGRPRIEVCAGEDSKTGGRYLLTTEVVAPAGSEEAARAEAHRVYREARGRQGEDPDLAAAGYRRAAALWRSAGDAHGEAWVALKLAELSAGRGDLEAAAGHYRQASDLFSDLGEHHAESSSLTSLGNVLRLLGRNSEAIAAHRRSLDSAMSHDDEIAERIALNNIAVIVGEQGNSKMALGIFHRLLDLWRRDGDVLNEVKVLSSIGSIYLNLGQEDLAGHSFAEAETRAEALGDRELRAHLLEQKGRVYLENDGLEEAREAFEQALEWRADSPRRSGTLTNLSRVLLRLGQREASERILHEALSEARTTGWRSQEATIHLNLAKAREAVDPAAALGHCREAFALLTGEAADRNGEASAELCEARMLAALGRLEEARDHAERSLEIVEDLRRQTWHPSQRAAYFATRRASLDLLVGILADMALERPSPQAFLATFAAAERGRARTLSEVVKHSDPVQQADRSAVWQRIKATVRRREVAASETERARLDREVEVLLERERMLAAELSRHPEVSAPLTDLELADFRRRLEDGDQLLAYHLGEQRGFVWLIDSQQVILEELPMSVPRIDLLARSVHDQAQDPQSAVSPRAQASLESLAQAILGPVRRHLRGQRLILLLDGALHYVPFAALPDGSGGALVNRFQMVRLPSVATFLSLEDLQEGRPKPARELAVLADPVFRREDAERQGFAEAAARSMPALLPEALRSRSGGLVPRLPATRREALALARLTAGGSRSVFLGFDASRENLFSPQVSDVRILHLATHAVVHPTQPELSGILLSLYDPRGEPQDGFVRAYELSGLDLAAELVVLSACKTAVGREVPGEGFLSLTRSFLGRGVPRVLVSLWAVDDVATGELMVAFYEAYLGEGLDAPAALARAQRRLASHPQWKDPYYWAGFVLEGDWR